jgi:hypothetical protein
MTKLLKKYINFKNLPKKKKTIAIKRMRNKFNKEKNHGG